MAATFSPDGRRIAVAPAFDKDGLILDAASAKEVLKLHGHEFGLDAVAFSPDGARIVTGSYDKTARVWDASTGRELAVLRGHDDDVRAAEFSPDGTRILTASSDGTARIWDSHFAMMPAQAIVREVCTHQLTGLTTLSREEMRLAGYPEGTPAIDVCAGVN